MSKNLFYSLSFPSSINSLRGCATTENGLLLPSLLQVEIAVEKEWGTCGISDV